MCRRPIQNFVKIMYKYAHNVRLDPEVNCPSKCLRRNKNSETQFGLEQQYVTRRVCAVAWENLSAGSSLFFGAPLCVCVVRFLCILCTNVICRAILVSERVGQLACGIGSFCNVSMLIIRRRLQANNQFRAIECSFRSWQYPGWPS
jgi:hypothetical protein